MATLVQLDLFHAKDAKFAKGKSALEVLLGTGCNSKGLIFSIALSRYHQQIIVANFAPLRETKVPDFTLPHDLSSTAQPTLRPLRPLHETKMQRLLRNLEVAH